MKCTKEFRALVLAADDHRCANPFCKHPIPAFDDFKIVSRDPFACWLTAHSLMPPNHDDINEAITVCAHCHNYVEKGTWMHEGWTECTIPVRTRVTAREYEIKILEWYRDNRPDKFRWGPVLDYYYKKRKVVFDHE